MKKNNYKIIFGFSVLLLASSCKKDYLETKPSNALDQAQLIGSTSDIAGSLSGGYTQLFGFAVGGATGHDNYGQKSYDCQSDLMGTDIVVNSAGFGWYNRDYQYVNWGLPANNTHSDVAWVRYYDMIKQMNTIIENVGTATGGEDEKAKLKGQALGMRANCYFYLINYMQQTYKGNEDKPGVPLFIENTDGNRGRGTVRQVYTQIIKDLELAETLLTGKTFTDKTYVDIHVVQGIRARVALIMNDWQIAATYANKAYTYGATPQLMTEAQYKEGFSKMSNPEWMWGSFIPSAQATIYASFFSHYDIKTGGYASLGGQKKISKFLYDKIPVGDVRKTVFQQNASLTPANGNYTSVISGYSAPSAMSPVYNQLKFRVPTPGNWAADYVYMRTAEMYLIEAEAQARLGNDAASKLVLEKLIKTRYPAYTTVSFSGQSLVDEILLQRRIELWGEGFSLIDIKRTNRGLDRPTGSGNHGSPNLEAVVYTLPDASPRFLMRIPQRELDANPLMTAADQNP